jgi:hypothetical protein
MPDTKIFQRPMNSNNEQYEIIPLKAEGVMSKDKRFLSLLQDALKSIHEPRFFETERGFQGELLVQLAKRLREAAFPGDPVVEQEYQKTIPSHGIKIRPDIIIHVPFASRPQ